MKISIIIPTYNRGTYIDKALESIKNQIDFNLQDIEVVIVDDGSTDNTKDVIEKWSNILDINYLKQKNSGVCISRNIAIKNAKNNVVMFFDDDAIMNNDCLKNVSDVMEKEKAVVGKVMPKTDNIWKYFSGHYNQGNEMHESNSFLETVAVFYKEVFDNVGYLNENIDYGSEGEEYFGRLKQTDYKLMYYPNIIIYHDYSNGILKFIKKQYKFGEKMLYVKNIRLNSVFDVIKNYRDIKRSTFAKASADKSNKEIKNNIFKTDPLFKDIKFFEKIFFVVLSKIGVIAHLIGTIKGFYKYNMSTFAKASADKNIKN